jgi:hypothetical protein
MSLENMEAKEAREAAGQHRGEVEERLYRFADKLSARDILNFTSVDQAAVDILALLNRAALAEAEVLALKDDLDSYMVAANAYMRGEEAAEARVAVLEGALEALADAGKAMVKSLPSHWHGEAEDELAGAVNDARAALQPQPSPVGEGEDVE